MGRDVQYNHRWVFYYDAGCDLCTRMMWWASRIDFFHQITWTPYQTLEMPPHGLSWEDLDHAAYLYTGQGRLHKGFYAIRMLALRLLPFIPLAPILWFPGVNLAGVPVYRWVARNRYRISGCRIPRLNVNRQERPQGPS